MEEYKASIEFVNQNPAEAGDMIAITSINGNISAVQRLMHNSADERAEYSYDIDGVVIKIDDFSQREMMGATTKVPKWAVAYKYPPEEKETILKEIEISDNFKFARLFVPFSLSLSRK